MGTPLINTDEPLVSIIIPVYNAAGVLEETIKSAMGQTWPNKEVILIDDSSTDGSLQIMKKFEGDGIIVLTVPNRGASVARNKGLEHARGHYIQFLDADDLLSEDKIESQVKRLNGSVDHLALSRTAHFLDGSDHRGAVLTDDWYDSDTDNPVDFLLKLYAGDEIMPGYGGMITINAWLTPRNLINLAGPWNTFRGPDDDGEFFCRVVLASRGIKFSPEGVNYYRKYRTSHSLAGQTNAAALQNIILATDLKREYLSKKADPGLVDRIFSRHYWFIGLQAFPLYPKISHDCIAKSKKLGYVPDRYDGGQLVKLFYKLFGWKVARLLTFIRNGR